MARIAAEKHWSTRSWLENLPMNLLPQLETLWIDIFSAVRDVKAGVDH